MMRIIIEWTLFLLILQCVTVSSAATAPIRIPNQQHIHAECSYTRYPSLCVTALSKDPQGVDKLSVLIEKTISETELPLSANFRSSDSRTDDNAAVYSTLEYCEELMNMSLQRLNQSLSAVKISPRKYKPDIQTWLSSALTLQQSCRDSVHSLGLSDGDDLGGQISNRMDYLSQLGSNALALINRISGHTESYSTIHRKTKEEQEAFPSWVSARDRKLLQVKPIDANVVVAKDGTGQYTSITQAINAASGKNRFVIYVKSGLYKEKIKTNKNWITLIGDGKYSTIISASGSLKGGSSLYNCATLTITADGFIARDIGFENTAGPGGEQALALAISGDRSVLFRCSMAGYQDTLFAATDRQFYRECDIYGTIDPIFGNAAAVFQSCNIYLRRPKGNNVILANGRTDPGQSTGFSLQRCTIRPSSEFAKYKHSYNSYLGRPWKEYSRAVIMQSFIDDAINPRGWLDWPGASSYSKTLYFAEYANTGPGASTSGRVQWPGYHVIGTPEASKFTVGNFIAGTSWIPSSGATFISGL